MVASVLAHKLVVSRTAKSKRSLRLPRAIQLKHRDFPLHSDFFRSFVPELRISNETPKGFLCDYLYGQLRPMVHAPDLRKLELFESNCRQVKTSRGTGVFFLAPYYDRTKKQWQTYLNLGIPRGLSGGLLVFSYLHEADFEKKRCGRLAEGLARTLLEVNDSSPDLYPAFWGRVKKRNPYRNGWCYGDLSVGFSLLQFGSIFDRAPEKKVGLELFGRGLRRFLESDEGPCLCHGSSGVLSMAVAASRIVRSKRIDDSVPKLKRHLKNRMNGEAVDERIFLFSNAAARMCLTEIETGCSDWTERLLLLKNPFLVARNGG